MRPALPCHALGFYRAPPPAVAPRHACSVWGLFHIVCRAGQGRGGRKSSAPAPFYFWRAHLLSRCLPPAPPKPFAPPRGPVPSARGSRCLGAQGLRGIPQPSVCLLFCMSPSPVPCPVACPLARMSLLLPLSSPLVPSSNPFPLRTFVPGSTLRGVLQGSARGQRDRGGRPAPHAPSSHHACPPVSQFSPPYPSTPHGPLLIRCGGRSAGANSAAVRWGRHCRPRHRMAEYGQGQSGEPGRGPLGPPPDAHPEACLAPLSRCVRGTSRFPFTAPPTHLPTPTPIVPPPPAHCWKATVRVPPFLP